MLNTLYYSEQAREISLISFHKIFSADPVYYADPRDDPIFPAVVNPQPSHFKQSYFYNYTAPKIIGCVHETQLCDSTDHDCWYLPPSLAKESFPDTAKTSVTKTTMARKLLSTVLSASVVFPYASTNKLDAVKSCRYDQCEFPTEQWKVEARTWFETSLATIQILFLDILRDQNASSSLFNQPVVNLVDRHNISGDYQAICKMGKFRSQGWRNVSVWGFLGIHFAGAAIFVASIKTEDERLWLAIGTQHVYQASCWLIGAIHQVFWRSVGILRKRPYRRCF